METTHEIVEKVQEVFDRSLQRVHNGLLPVCVREDEIPVNLYDHDDSRQEWIWTMYMNSLGVLIITRDDLVESFSEMVNFGDAVKYSVCITNPADASEFLLVPDSLAEKCLVLGTLA